MKKQRGMALLIVLLIMSLMAIIAVNISDSWQRSLRSNQSQQDHLRAKWLLSGGEIYAKERLLQAGELQRGWGTSGMALSMLTKEGEVAIRLRFVDACFNVNALSHPPPADPDNRKEVTASIEKQIFMLLLNNLGLTEPQAEAIADAIILKAEREGFLMGELSELREIREINRELYLRLAPFLCANPDTELRVNLNAVSEHQLPLLRAMLMNVPNSEQLRTLLASREQSGWQVQDFLSKEKVFLGFDAESQSKRLVIDDSRWTVQLKVTLNDNDYRLTSEFLLDKSGIVVSRRQFTQGRRQDG